MARFRPLSLAIAVLALALSAAADVAAQRGQEPPTPARKEGEGEGPYRRLIIRGATVIDGTGAPPQGPMDIVIEGNRIVEVRSVGYPHLPINESRRPQGADREIDATGMYVMPGFVDLHVHAGGGSKNPAEYAYKLWLAHGVTTVRGVSLGPFDWSIQEQARSARNEIVAPRIFNYQRPGSGWDRGPIDSPEKAREWVRWAASRGIDGLKLSAHDPEIMAALIDEAKKHKLGTTAHLAQMGVANMNALDAARLGLGTVTHHYGLFESMYEENDIQPFPVDYNYNDEQHRFGQVARQWNLVKPRGEKWNALLKEFKELGVTLDPTFTIYEASRNVMAARTREWHDKYTLPSLWEFFQPSREAHGSYWFDWTTHDEVAWKNYYRVWMQFVNDYKNMGGRVTTGSDAGFIYSTYGFGYIHELELLQEAGFHPLEVIRSATMYGAQTLFEPKGERIQFGVIRPGMLADLVIVPENPLQNFKTLYGHGFPRLNDQTGKVERVGGVKYTIKDGIVYDAKKLLEDVARMVEEAKRAQRVAADSQDQ
ncbi:MAG TPA: amidohydrolase family protein [Longimicrobiales bacterium]|nr:amidohydrolase family protein [Longimicrobiales bacterium]